MQFPLIGSAVLFGLYVVVKFVKKEYLVSTAAPRARRSTRRELASWLHCARARR